MDIEPLVQRGFVVTPGFVPGRTVSALRERALVLDAQGAFRAAGVGTGRVERPDVRGDRILWLDQATTVPAERTLLGAVEALRSRINRALFLGLWDFEAHYAIYPAAAFYARHLDRFARERPGAPSRVVSFVLYLNDAWRAEHGGALRIHVDERTRVDVVPEGGTLACFLAERFEHEVLPATRQRLAVTGWFRTRGK